MIDPHVKLGGEYFCKICNSYHGTMLSSCGKNFGDELDIQIDSKPIKLTTGYSCPNCGTICSGKTLLDRGEVEFDYEPDPHYSWTETHQCNVCETIYIIKNGT